MFKGNDINEISASAEHIFLHLMNSDDEDLPAALNNIAVAQHGSH